jgi:microcystin-dependent protein
MYVGEIRLLANSYEPEGWAFCDGRMLDPKKYPDLFQKIGATFGGDGKTTFAVPDLRGGAPVHRASGSYLGAVGSIEFDGGRSRQHARVPIHYFIATTIERHYPEDMAIISEVRLWANEKSPRDWIPCSGQLMPISRNTALFSLLGTAFGGDGRQTFALPDLRGAFAFHPEAPDDRGHASGARAYDGAAKPLLAMQYCIAIKGVYPPRPS